MNLHPIAARKYGDSATSRLRAPAFTLIELMVVLVIISILSALMLAGLAGARQRAKVDKTKSTIRKIHEIVMPQCESYLTRRLPSTIYTSSTNGNQRARDRLTGIRSLMLHEMPDTWSDVALSGTSRALANGKNIPTYAWTGAPRAFGAFNATLTTSATTTFGGAECLFLIVTRSGLQADSIEMFRTDEIGDTDSDKAPEFLDGWSRPIRFIRWAPGFLPSLVQSTSVPDPFDPFSVSGPPPDFGLVPLIYSSGPDGGLATTGTDGYGITGPPAGGWSNLSLNSITNPAGVSPLPGTPDNQESRDNITNHDLMSKR